MPVSSTERRITAEEVSSESRLARIVTVPRCCELHGVPGKIEENLTQSPGVAPQMSWQAGADDAQKFQPFLLRFDRQQLGRILHYGAQVEILDFELHLAGLDFGEVQDVVDQSEQRLAA